MKSIMLFTGEKLVITIFHSKLIPEEEKKSLSEFFISNEQLIKTTVESIVETHKVISTSNPNFVSGIIVGIEGGIVLHKMYLDYINNKNKEETSDENVK